MVQRVPSVLRAVKASLHESHHLLGFFLDGPFFNMRARIPGPSKATTSNPTGYTCASSPAPSTARFCQVRTPCRSTGSRAHPARIAANPSRRSHRARPEGHRPMLKTVPADAAPAIEPAHVEMLLALELVQEYLAALESEISGLDLTMDRALAMGFLAGARNACRPPQPLPRTGRPDVRQRRARRPDRRGPGSPATADRRGRAAPGPRDAAIRPTTKARRG